MSYKKLIRHLSNIVIILIWILIFYFQFEHPFITRTAQNISPALLITTIPHTLFWIGWISVPLLLFGILKGRLFCWKICPIGLLQDLLPSFKKTKASKINLYMFLFLLTVSFFGLNLLAILDPMVTFNRAIILFNLRLKEFLIFSSIFIAITALNIYKKRFWCFKLCPLGAFFDFTRSTKYDLDKRRTLIVIGSGLAFAGLLKIKPFSIHDRLLRPPGALPENEFKNRCIRCGSCIAVCLTGTLTASFLDSGFTGLFSPKLVPQIAECDEYCNKCGEACPSQAIKKLPLSVKRNFKIGTAKIDRSVCFSWSFDKYCLICKEFCSYLAIGVVKNKNGIPAPEEVSSLCRGCGHCENHCPTRPIRAIKVYNDGVGKIINT